MPQSTSHKIFENHSELKRPAVSLLTNRQWRYLQRRYKITPREMQIARLICRGFGNEEIAVRLNITTGTVKVHVRNLYRKTWAENKILMLLRFIEDASGISPTPAPPPTANS
ncbi:MAG: response regulator transcription factor [Planctomycetes bacterium]|nr:response regulator transcription factor [Planctomycetota bacterium]